jgi:cell division protein FtsL
MAPDSSSAAARGALPEPRRGSAAPDPRSAPRRPPLRILGPATRPKDRRGNRMLVLLSALLVVGSLMAVVVADDVIAQDQVSLSTAQRQVTTLTNTHRELQIQVSVQQAPQAVVKTAEGQLGMVPAGQITDLPEVSLSTPLPVPQTAPIPAPATATTAAAASSSSNASPN